MRRLWQAEDRRKGAAKVIPHCFLPSPSPSLAAFRLPAAEASPHLHTAVACSRVCMAACRGRGAHRHTHRTKGLLEGRASPALKARMATVRAVLMRGLAANLAPNSWRQEGQAFLLALFTRSCSTRLFQSLHRCFRA